MPIRSTGRPLGDLRISTDPAGKRVIALFNKNDKYSCVILDSEDIDYPVGLPSSELGSKDDKKSWLPTEYSSFEEMKSSRVAKALLESASDRGTYIEAFFDSKENAALYASKHGYRLVTFPFMTSPDNLGWYDLK